MTLKKMVSMRLHLRSIELLEVMEGASRLDATKQVERLILEEAKLRAAGSQRIRQILAKPASAYIKEVEEGRWKMSQRPKLQPEAAEA